MNFGDIKSIHFVGIGGIGMSGIAEILSNYDLDLSGCDMKASPITRRLEGRGIRVATGHDPAHLGGVDLVVISSAIPRSNAEVVAAGEKEIPVIRRAEMLGEITRLKRAIAISGTHGKTTTSAMIAMVLAAADLDPTLIVGGVLRDLDTSARLGAGEYLVVEADEYDRSFLTLHPTIAIVTNIEADHLDVYANIEEIEGAFEGFVSNLPLYGVIVGCVDDQRVCELLRRVPRRSVRYGLGQEASLRAVAIRRDGAQTSFDVDRDGEVLGRITLRVPGDHNVRNALAAVGVALELDVEFETIARALGRFAGVERRFQILGDFQGTLVVDDYAHHPTEVRTTLEAARYSYPERRIVALFQPHLYSRTRDFFDDFAVALSGADVAYVAPVYPSREEPIEGVSASLITDAAARRGAVNVHLADCSHDGLVEKMREVLDENDLLLTLGAGDVNLVGKSLVGGVA